MTSPIYSTFLTYCEKKELPSKIDELNLLGYYVENGQLQEDGKYELRVRKINEEFVCKDSELEGIVRELGKLNLTVLSSTKHGDKHFVKTRRISVGERMLAEALEEKERKNIKETISGLFKKIFH